MYVGYMVLMQNDETKKISYNKKTLSKILGGGIGQNQLAEFPDETLGPRAPGGPGAQGPKSGARNKKTKNSNNNDLFESPSPKKTK